MRACRDERERERERENRLCTTSIGRGVWWRKEGHEPTGACGRACCVALRCVASTVFDFDNGCAAIKHGPSSARLWTVSSRGVPAQRYIYIYTHIRSRCTWVAIFPYVPHPYMYPLAPTPGDVRCAGLACGMGGRFAFAPTATRSAGGGEEDKAWWWSSSSSGEADDGVPSKRAALEMEPAGPGPMSVSGRQLRDTVRTSSLARLDDVSGRGGRARAGQAREMACPACPARRGADGSTTRQARVPRCGGACEVCMGGVHGEGGWVSRFW